MTEKTMREKFEEWYNKHFFNAGVDTEREAACEDAWRAALSEASQDRDKDWVLAIGHALGLDSGYNIPIVPLPEGFKKLFAAIRSREASQGVLDGWQPVPVEVFDALSVWSGAEPSQSVLAIAVDNWRVNRHPSPTREEKMVIISRDSTGFPTVWCDPEIADLVKVLNEGGLPTVASCSGHGHRPGSIALKDGRELMVMTFDEARIVGNIFPGINGEPPKAMLSAAPTPATRGSESFCPHCNPCRHGNAITLNEQYDAMLRELCMYLSVGGFNSEGFIDPKLAGEKIRWGVDYLIEAEKHRATPPTNDADNTGDAEAVYYADPDRIIESKKTLHGHLVNVSSTPDKQYRLPLFTHPQPSNDGHAVKLKAAEICIALQVEINDESSAADHVHNGAIADCVSAILAIPTTEVKG